MIVLLYHYLHSKIIELFVEYADDEETSVDEERVDNVTANVFDNVIRNDNDDMNHLEVCNRNLYEHVSTSKVFENVIGNANDDGIELRLVIETR